MSAHQAHATLSLVRLLDEDKSLASVLDRADLAAARRYAVVECIELGRGPYGPGELVEAEGLLGLLVLDGLLVRQVAVAGRPCGELLGPRSIVRPWDDFGRHAPLPFEVRWRVVQDARLAVLDRRFLATIVRWPALIQVLIDRTFERAHMLASNVAIHNLQHVELRLLVLLWHLADRFGKVTSEGVHLPLPLAHADLAELVGAARPSVSTALKELAAKGEVWRHEADRTWMLSLAPPQELRDMRRQHRLGAEEPVQDTAPSDD
jgi:CRP/FNR family cyclic AMP-dependent transcriptional regulator